MNAAAISVALLPHPSDPSPVVEAVECVLEPQDHFWSLRYCARDGGDLLVPAPVGAGHADGLWRHTCFELFVATPSASSYREFNFSPSGQWACYAFTRYRERDPDFAPPPDAAPHIQVWRSADRLTLDVRLPRVLLPAGATEGPWRLGVSAVMASQQGGIAHWALCHPGPRPDFHARDALVLTLG